MATFGALRPSGGRAGDGLLTEQLADAGGYCRELVKMPNPTLPLGRRTGRVGWEAVIHSPTICWRRCAADPDLRCRRTPI